MNARRLVKVWKRRRAAKARRGRRLQAKLLLVSLAGLLAGFGYALAYLAPQPTGGQITLDQLSGLADEHRIARATFLDEDSMMTGVFSCARPARAKDRSPAAAVCDKAVYDPTPAKARAEAPSKGARKHATKPKPIPDVEVSFWMSYPQSDLATGVLLQTVTKAGASVSVDPQTAKAQVRMVTTFLLPLMILANLFALLFSLGRAGSSGIGEVIVFGSLARGRVKRALFRRKRARPVTFGDVGGADEAVTELSEVVDYLRAPERYKQIGAMAPKGILMIGPPGCGKTLLAKAAAGEAKVPFFSVAGAEFVESLVGVGAARVRDLFQRVRAVAPAIVFIDELDAAGRRRGVGGGGGGTDEREQTLNQLLVEMDGFDASSGIVVIGATNRPDILDPALLRPGRFDRHITVDQPDRDGRRTILELHARGRKLASGVELDQVARRTPGFSGADLANVINEAALLAVRASKSEIEMGELLESIERVLAGPQRRGRVLTAEERRRAATHEAGHAVATTALGGADQIHRVSILSRGRTLGAASLHRESDAALLTRTALEQRLVATMGGVAAEEMSLGEPSTAGEGDLEEATRIARDMIARFGMSARLGRARLLGRDSEAFLDGDVPFATLSAGTQHEVDAEVRALLDRAEANARAILAANRDALETIVGRLETEEILEGEELERALSSVRARAVSLEPDAAATRPRKRPART